MRHNPFQAGPIVSGESFIGREEKEGVLDKLRRKIFSGNEYSPSIILTGLPRMGKTSLACKCIEDKAALNRNGIFPSFCNMGKQKNFTGFIYSMVRQVRKSYKNAPFFDDELESAFAFFETKPEEWDVEDVVDALDELFYILGQEKQAKTVVVLDEFDSVVDVFEGQVRYFHILRDLVTQPDYRFTLLMTSRRDIAAIEEDGALPVGSTFANSVHSEKLQGFSDADLALYFATMEACGVSLPETQKRQVLFYAGRSPFLLSMLGHEILDTDETIPADGIDIDELAQGVKEDMDRYFVSLLGYMRRERDYKKMVQIFIGPRYDITSKDIADLKTRGYLYQEERKEGFNDPVTGEKLRFQTISEYFVEYLQNYQEENEKSEGLTTWVELTQAEKFLREVIQNAMEKEYGKENWEDALKDGGCKKQRNAFFNVEQINNYMDSHCRRFSSRKDLNVLKFIGIDSLSKIIVAYWDKYFSAVFDPPYKTEKTIQSDMKKLHWVRNPLAHAFAECLTEMDRENVNRVCKKMEEVAARLKKAVSN